MSHERVDIGLKWKLLWRLSWETVCGRSRDLRCIPEEEGKGCDDRLDRCGVGMGSVQEREVYEHSGDSQPN